MVHGRRMTRIATLGVWLVFLAIQTPSRARGAEPLTENERLAYAAWLGATRALAAPGDSVPAAGTPLFPTLMPAGAGASRLASSREVIVLENEAGTRTARPRTMALALGAARAYRDLGEYDKALSWYSDAALEDEGRQMAATLDREALGAAVALGDTQGAAPRLAARAGADDPVARADEIVLAYRHFIVQGDSAALATLSRRLDARGAELPIAVRFWRTFAAAMVRDWEPALAGARSLACATDSAATLTRRQRLWLAGALPDLLLLANRRAEAGDLYRQLAASDLDELAPWARYQLANLDLLAGRYGAATDALRLLCASPEPWPWHERACGLAALADTLALLAGGGAGHGAVAVAGR